MAWEWAGPVSGAVVGLGGLVAGWRISVGGRKHDERLAQQRHEYETRASDAKWHRDRRADAYVELLDLAERMGAWIGMVHPMWDTDPPRRLPDIPSPSFLAIWILGKMAVGQMVVELGKPACHPCFDLLSPL